MYEDFTAQDPLDQRSYHCVYQAIIVGIATRHSDTVDIKYLVNGRGIWLGLPHLAWLEFRRRTGYPLADRMAVDLAGLYLKRQIESGAGADRSHWNDIGVEEIMGLAGELGWLDRHAPAATAG